MPYDMEPLRLETIHPEINEQVQHALSQIVESFHDESPRFDADVRKAQLTVVVDIEFTVADGRVEIAANVKTKLPGYRSVQQRFARLPHGGARILVEQDDSANQLPLTVPQHMKKET